MNIDHLLAEFEQVSAAQRIKRMVALGQQARNNPQSSQLIAQLAQSSSIYQRRLALWSCYGSHDSSLIRRFISDPAQSLIQLAIELMAVYGNDADVQASLSQLAAPFWRKTLKLLAKQGRFHLIDAFLATLETQQLPAYQLFGSEQYYNQHKASIIHQLKPADWSHFARFKPRECADAVQQILENEAHNLTHKQHIFNQAIPDLVTYDPDRALALLQTAINQQIALQALQLQALANQRPQAIANLMIQRQQAASINWGNLLSKLDLDSVLQLAELNLLPRPGLWLSKIASAYRSALYAAHHRQWYNEQLLLADDAIWQALPSNERQYEARRIQQLPNTAGNLRLKIHHAAYLPWNEAWQALQPALKHNEAEFRGEALASLIKIVRYQPEYAQTALDLVHDRRNEQDPVRVKMLSALSELPAWRWHPEHLASIEQIIRGSLNARDCSDASIRLLQRWLSKLLEVHPQASIELISQISRERGKLFVQRHGRELNASEAQALCAALLPIMQSWQRRQQAEDILSIINFVGRAIKDVPELLAMLEQIANDTIDWAAMRAVYVLHRYARRMFNQVVPRILAHDRSWITQDLIANFVHTKRQDLLTPFLPAQRYKGKFSTGDAAYILPIQHGFERWTTTQQQIFAEAVSIQTEQEDLQHQYLVEYAQRLAYLSEVAPTRLIELAQLDAPIEVLRDKALEALSRRETGDGVPTLIEALGDARARVAIYALRRVLLRMPTSQALAILRTVPTSKITVAKETIRLIGDLKNRAAYQELLRWNELELHRDVRIALVHALNNYLDQPETWQIFERLLSHEETTVVKSLTRISPIGQPLSLHEPVLRLLAALVEHPNLEVREEAVGRCFFFHGTDPQRILVEPLTKALMSGIVRLRDAAVRSLLTSYAIEDSAVITAIVRENLPNRAVINELISTLDRQVSAFESYHPLGHAVINELARDRFTILLQIQLAGHCYDEQTWFNFVQQLKQQGLLNVNTFRTVLEVVEKVANRIWLAQPEQLETFFYQSNDPYLRRIGLAAFGFKTKRLGWYPADYQRLAEYQADPTELVAVPAQFIFPPQLETTEPSK
ncbi:HEAT repeat domain-containing protein [Herpetosiphon llansteffanensis]